MEQQLVLTEKTTKVVEAAFIKEPCDTKVDPKGYRLRIPKIEARAGETVHWCFKDGETEHDHVLSIWFPISGVFVSPVLAVKHSGSVEAMIPETATKNVEFEYCIYDHTEGAFVEGGSHPKIEVPFP